MRLCKVQDVLKQRVEDIENSIIDGFTDLASMLDAERRLEDARTALLPCRNQDQGQGKCSGSR
jgi:hypothetical protein